jgi:AraC-like DNA-binding protein
MAVRSPRELRRIADDYLSLCMRQETRPHVNELAATLRMSASDFSALFLKIVGERPSGYLKRRQIEHAKRLLRQSSLTMNVIAYKCGFGTRTTFFRAFKGRVGITPLAYRAGKKRVTRTLI